MRLVLALGIGLLAVPTLAQVPGGTYTLNPSGGDFESFSEAVARLVNDGVSGPVVIEVAQATYAERVRIEPIPGTSATNTVTFRGIPNGGTLPLITEEPSSSEPYVVALQKASWVRLEALRFEVANPNQSRGTVLSIESDDVIVTDCEVQSIDDLAVAGDDAVGIDVYGSRVTVQDTEVDDGDIGIRYGEGVSGLASGGKIWGNSLDRNVSAGIVVEDQAVTSGNAVSIRDNSVIQNAVDEAGWIGIWLRDNTGGAVLARNAVIARSGTGIRIETVTNSTAAWTSVVNNAVFGSRFRLQSDAEGIQIDGAERVRVLNNSVKIEETAAPERNGGVALLVDASSSDVRVANNILVHDGDGLNLDIENLGSITDLDYQVFEAPTAPDLMRVVVGGTEYTALGKYQGATGDSQNTIAWTVEFLGADLRLDGRSDGDGQLIGQPEPGVPSDIDGDSRDATYPYRGADEAATPLAPPPPLLSGTYVIGSAGDYADFGAAFDAIAAVGLGGPVVFEVKDGTYTEASGFGVPLNVEPFPGSSSVRTVTFRSVSGSAPDVVVEADAFNFNFNWVIELTNVQHLTFEDITFRSLDTQYADVVWVRGGNDIVFDGCAFETAATTATGTLVRIGGSISGGPDRNPRDTRVLNSTFTGGRTAINIQIINGGGTFGDEGDFEVIGNTITGLHPTFDGIRMNGQASGTIRGNVVTSPTSGPDFIGIDVGGGSTGVTQSDVIVEANEVTANDGVGLSWDGYAPNLPNEPQVVYRLINNTVRMNGNGDAVGLRITDSDGLIAAHNTASVASSSGASAAAVVDLSYFSTSIDLRNNIFDANAGRALDLAMSTISSRYVYDDNAFWSDGAVLARYDIGSSPAVDCADLACIQAASQSASSGGNQDLNSIVKNVAFLKAGVGDLRLAASMAGDQDLAGAGLPEVTTDIDGDPRSATRPYRGADELAASLTFITLRPRVFLEGAYEYSCGSVCAVLSTALQDGGHLPLSNPYADPVFDGTLAEHDGTESVTQAELDAMDPITDWVVVALRETPDGPEVYRGAYLLNRFGRVLALDGTPEIQLPLPAGDYHVVIYHRNHLPVMSTVQSLVDEPAEDVELFRATELYDWPNGITRLHETFSYVHEGMAAGDGSGDGLVTAPDFNVYSSASAVGAAGYRIEDYTMDGLVTAPDFNVYNANAAAGAATAVPEN